MRTLSGVTLCVLVLVMTSPARAQEYQDWGVYVGCGFVVNKAPCDGCQNTDDDCACSRSVCKTNHRVCSQAFRAFDADPAGFHVWRRTAKCYKRYRCNNDSGEDQGLCLGSGHCTTSEEWVYGDSGQEYYITFWCPPV